MNIIDIDAAAAPPADGAASGPSGPRARAARAPATPPDAPSPAEQPPRLVHDWSDRGDRERMIAEAAYFRAERRGFGLGEAEIDWLEAERELTERMATDRLPADGGPPAASG